MRLPKNFKIQKCINSFWNSKGLQNHTLPNYLLNTLLCLINEKRKYRFLNPYKFYDQELNLKKLLKYTEGLFYLMKKTNIQFAPMYNKLKGPNDYIFITTYDKNDVNIYVLKYIEKSEKTDDFYIPVYMELKALKTTAANIKGTFLFYYIIHRNEQPQQLKDFITKKEKKQKFTPIKEDNIENYYVNRDTKWMKEFDKLASFNRWFDKIKLKGEYEYLKLIHSKEFKKFVTKEKKRFKKMKFDPIKAIRPEVLNEYPKKFFTGYKKLQKKYNIK